MTATYAQAMETLAGLEAQAAAGRPTHCGCWGDEEYQTGCAHDPEANRADASLALVRTLIEEHKPGGKVELMLHVDSDEPCKECDEGDGHLVETCARCYPTWDGYDAYAQWPCSHFLAALRVLEVS